LDESPSSGGGTGSLVKKKIQKIRGRQTRAREVKGPSVSFKHKSLRIFGGFGFFLPGKIKICNIFFFFVGLVHHRNLLSYDTLSLRVEFLKPGDGYPKIPRGLPLFTLRLATPGERQAEGL